MASVEETRSWPLDPCYFGAFQPHEGASCPLSICPHSRRPDCCCCCCKLRPHPNSSSCTSGTSGSAVAAGRDRRRPHGPHKHSPAQPAQQKGSRAHGNERGEARGGCSSSLWGGGFVPSCLPTTRCGRQSWSLGNLALEGGSQQQSQASGQWRLSNSNQQHNKQATSRQSVAPSSSNNGTKNRPDQQPRPAPCTLPTYALQPPRFSHACD